MKYRFICTECKCEEEKEIAIKDYDEQKDVLVYEASG